MAETYSSYGPQCPYCGHDHYPDGPNFYDENAETSDCEKCGKTFRMSVSTTTTWSCEEMEASQ